jgi:hypothetical protein
LVVEGDEFVRGRLVEGVGMGDVVSNPPLGSPFARFLDAGEFLSVKMDIPDVLIGEGERSHFLAEDTGDEAWGEVRMLENEGLTGDIGVNGEAGQPEVVARGAGPLVKAVGESDGRGSDGAAKVEDDFFEEEAD